jgi:hypothetical protein
LQCSYSHKSSHIPINIYIDIRTIKYKIANAIYKDTKQETETLVIANLVIHWGSGIGTDGEEICIIILVLELHVDDVELANKGKLTIDEIQNTESRVVIKKF